MAKKESKILDSGGSAFLKPIPIRLKNTKELTEFREAQAKLQNYVCPITENKLVKPCMDHDHSTHHCRMVLSSNSNVLEGRIRGAFYRYMQYERPKEEWPDVLRNLANYWEQDFSHQPWHPDSFKKDIINYKKLSAEDQKKLLTEASVVDPKHFKNLKARCAKVRRLLTDDIITTRMILDLLEEK